MTARQEIYQSERRLHVTVGWLPPDKTTLWCAAYDPEHETYVPYTIPQALKKKLPNTADHPLTLVIIRGDRVIPPTEVMWAVELGDMYRAESTEEQADLDCLTLSSYGFILGCVAGTDYTGTPMADHVLRVKGS